jgi:invasion protein IalB
MWKALDTAAAVAFRMKPSVDFVPFISLFIVAVGLVGVPVSAQQRTTATYDDWTISCADNLRVCEITSSQQLQGQSTIASQITISGIAKDKPLRISIQIPPNIWLASGMKLVTDDKDSGILAVFRWCVPGRCLADVEVKQDTAKKLADMAARQGALVFHDAAQREQKIPVSFKGLGSALDKLLGGSPNPSAASKAEDVKRFDGQWFTEAECQAVPPNTLKTNWTMVSKIESGKLFANFGEEGKPGSGKFEGVINADGHLELTLTGLTGNSKYNSNNTPEKTPYSWKAAGSFSGTTGRATRMEGRFCVVNFSKNS